MKQWHCKILLSQRWDLRVCCRKSWMFSCWPVWWIGDGHGGVTGPISKYDAGKCCIGSPCQIQYYYFVLWIRTIYNTNKKVLSWVASIRTTYILEMFKSAPIMLPLDKSPAVSALHQSVSPYIIPVQGTSKLRSRHHWYGGIVWSDSFSAPDMHIFVGKHMNSEQKRGPNTNSIHTRIKKMWGKTHVILRTP